jgi:hypothetical protein
MRSLARTGLVVLALVTASFAGVTITSPANGSTVTSPTHFVASATSNYPVTAMAIYVDNNRAFVASASSLDTYVSMTPGTHYVVVQAWDSTGAVFKDPITLNVSSTPVGSVTISSPTNGESVTSPVNFVASATSSAPITAMRIYVDGASTYTTYSSSLNVPIAIASGSHYVVVQAWDSTGAVFKSAVTITVVAAPSAGVTVSSPANHATVSSPVNFAASATSASPITAMRIYVDGANAYTVNAAYINAPVAMSPGAHNVVVQAWDSTGAVLKTALSLTVSPAPPSVPAYATTVSRIEEMPAWESCTVCAGAGANGPVASYSMAQGISWPSADGNAAQFWLGGNTPYANALWWKQLGANSAPTHFVYDLYFYVTNPEYAQALEFDLNHTTGGFRYIMGVQCNMRDTGVWEVWDGVGQTWRTLSLACTPPAANQWHHLTEEFSHDAAGNLTFVAITMDGAKYWVNRTYGSLPNTANDLNAAFQMDGDYAQHAYSVWLDQVTLYYW